MKCSGKVGNEQMIKFWWLNRIADPHSDPDARHW